jgi:hypothetical protein
LGYVLDAGVKGLLSFNLNPGHFSHPREFAFLQRALVNSPETVSGELMGEKGVIVFTVKAADGRARLLETTPLDKAQLRALIKLGETKDQQAGVGRERSYYQTTPALSLMQEHLQRIEEAVANAVNGVFGEEIEIPPSRNVGGVYTDAEESVRKGRYTLPPLSSLENPEYGPNL